MPHLQLKSTTTSTRGLTSATRRSALPPTVPVLTSHLENVVLSVHHRKLFNRAMRNEEAPPKDLEDLAHLDHNQTLLLFLDKSINKEEKKVPHQTLFHTC